MEPVLDVEFCVTAQKFLSRGLFFAVSFPKEMLQTQHAEHTMGNRVTQAVVKGNPY